MDLKTQKPQNCRIIVFERQTKSIKAHTNLGNKNGAFI